MNTLTSSGINGFARKFSQLSIIALSSLLLLGCSGSSDSGTTTTTTTTTTDPLGKYVGTYAIIAYTTDPAGSAYQKGTLTVFKSGLTTATFTAGSSNISAYPDVKGTGTIDKNAGTGAETGLSLSMTHTYSSGIYSGQTFTVKGLIGVSTKEVANGSHQIGPNKAYKWTADTFKAS
ncbi:hypothetical protein ACYVVU_10340 [Arenicellales bacterium IMCC55707]